MDATLLLHKPIVYGSELANAAFWALVVVHAVPGLVAPASGIVAMLAKKGSKRHLRAGRVFLWTMVFLAATGIVVDLVRLFVAVPQNHTSYPGMAMPSSIPARLGFVFAGACVLYLAYEATNRHVFKKRPLPLTAASTAVPAGLVVLGTALALYVVARLNPWTGALWMNITFVPIVVVTALLRRRQAADGRAGVAKHRFAMLALFAFSLWGALQGFGPAIGLAIGGLPDAPAVYTGAEPGPFTPFFFAFLATWAPFFLLSLYLVRRFARRRAALPAAA